MRWQFAIAALGILPSYLLGQDRQWAATTIQLPTFGVSIDATGELTVKSFVDPTGQLKAQRIAAARARLNADLSASSQFRKVSLAGVEKALGECLEAGHKVDESILYLAGLQRIQCVFLYPDAKDVVIAGPAEGWVPDGSGRIVGFTTARPVLRLEDLAEVLRVYLAVRQKQPFLGCTIDPSAEGLIRLQQFQKSIPNVVHDHQRTEVAEGAVRGTRAALGKAQVRVFGVSPATHFAQVLVEADYRMKCMAVGLEPPPVEMATFIGSMRTPPANSLQRWWFTPNYDCVRLSDDGLAMSIVGQGVQLQTEEHSISAEGKFTSVQRSPSRAAATFAKSFTDRYADIAVASPVYAELRNLIDLAIVAAWLQQKDVTTTTGWSGDLLRDEKRFTIESCPVPRNVSCVANAVWVRNRMLLPAGGGVSIHAHQALQKEHLLPSDPELGAKRTGTLHARPADRWWWD